MIARPEGGRARALSSWLAAVLVALGAAAWSLWTPRGAVDRPAYAARSSLSSRGRGSKLHISPKPVIANRVPSGSARDAGVRGRRDASRFPHPITPERIRIQHENQIIGALNDAVDLRNGALLRQILDDYRRRYPDDPNQLQEGYAIIADCLEHPGAGSTAAGQRYVDEKRGSILRRFVARHCLGR